MSKQAEEKLTEWAQWWDERKREGMPLEKKVAVQAKMIEGFFDIFAYFVRDLRRAEGRGDVKNSMLWLPHGMTKFADEKPRNPDDA